MKGEKNAEIEHAHQRLKEKQRASRFCWPVAIMGLNRGIEIDSLSHCSDQCFLRYVFRVFHVHSC